MTVEEPADQLTIALLQTIWDRFEAPGADAAGETFIDPDAIGAALSAVLGMLIDANPGVKTPRDFREAGEEAGKRIAYHARMARALFETTGVRKIGFQMVEKPANLH